MADVYLGIGSNVRPQYHIRMGLDELAGQFALLAISRVYQSKAVGFDGDDFLNLVVHIDTSLPLARLAASLREIEFAHGRTADCPKYAPRTLDIDILTYNDLCGPHDGILLPRPEMRTAAFVLRPFAEIAPQLTLPGDTQCLAALWAAFDDPDQTVHAVPWEGAIRENHFLANPH